MRIVIFLLITGFSCSLAQGFITIGGPGYESADGIIQTMDGGFAIAGVTNSYGAGGEDAYVIKLDGAGNLEWDRVIGGFGQERAWDIKQTPDGGYVVSAHTTSYGSGGRDILILKLDALGNVIWQKAIGENGDEYVDALVVTPDGSIIVVGGTTSQFGTGSSSRKLFVVKLTSSGALQWAQIVNTNWWVTGRGITLTRDGGFVVSGQLWGSPSKGGADAYLIKFDNMGNVQWARSIGGSNSERIYRVIEASDGSIVTAGHSYTYGLTNNTQDVYVIKLDAYGNLLWARAISGSNGGGANSIAESIDGGYVIAGLTNSFGASGGADIYIVKLDQNGTLEWTQIIRGSGYETAVGIASLNNGYFAVTGRTESVGNGDFDIFVTVIDENGNTSVGACPFTFSSGGTVVTGGILDSGWTAQFVTPNVIDVVANITTGGNVFVCTPLPIHFSEIHALCEEDGVIIRWQVTEPDLIKIMEVEKSSDGTYFLPIGNVSLTSHQTHSSMFQFKDISSIGVSKNTYYRIKGITLEGGVIYSPVVRATCGEKDFVLFPNPTSDFIQLNLADLSGRVQIHLINSSGEVILTTEKYIPISSTNGESLLIPVQHLPSGIYFLQVVSAAGSIKQGVFQKY